MGALIVGLCRFQQAGLARRTKSEVCNDTTPVIDADAIGGISFLLVLLYTHAISCGLRAVCGTEDGMGIGEKQAKTERVK